MSASPPAKALATPLVQGHPHYTHPPIQTYTSFKHTSRNSSYTHKHTPYLPTPKHPTTRVYHNAPHSQHTPTNTSFGNTCTPVGQKSSDDLIINMHVCWTWNVGNYYQSTPRFNISYEHSLEITAQKYFLLKDLT